MICDWKMVPSGATIRFLDEAGPAPLSYLGTTFSPHFFEVVVIEIADGIPRRRSNWTPTVPLVERARSYKIPTKSNSYTMSDPDVTIAADGFEVHVLVGRYDGLTARPPNLKKIYTVVKAMNACEVEEWMHHNLPHFVAYNKRERVDKAAERRWLNKHATGQWSLSPIDGGVRFAVETDAFWFKMSRT